MVEVPTAYIAVVRAKRRFRPGKHLPQKAKVVPLVAFQKAIPILIRFHFTSIHFHLPR